MTREARIMSGVILITVPTIHYGGYFLLTSLMDWASRYMDNPLRQNFFRAGHAHAGVIVLLSLVCQVLADGAALPSWLLWAVRIGVPLAAILIPAGFFLSMPSPDAAAPNGLVSLIYVGAVVLAVSVVALGIGLLEQSGRARAISHLVWLVEAPGFSPTRQRFSGKRALAPGPKGQSSCAYSSQA